MSSVTSALLALPAWRWSESSAPLTSRRCGAVSASRRSRQGRGLTGRPCRKAAPGVASGRSVSSVAAECRVSGSAGYPIEGQRLSRKDVLTAFRFADLGNDRAHGVGAADPTWVCQGGRKESGDSRLPRREL